MEVEDAGVGADAGAGAGSDPSVHLLYDSATVRLKPTRCTTLFTVQGLELEMILRDAPAHTLTCRHTNI